MRFGQFGSPFTRAWIAAVTPPDDDDDEDDEFGRRWSPDAEVNMLENEVGNYPESEIWVDFYNDLCDTDWCNKK